MQGAPQRARVNEAVALVNEGATPRAVVEVAPRSVSRGDPKAERSAAFVEPSQPDPYPHVPPAAWAETEAVARREALARRYESLPPRGFIDLSADPAQSGSARVTGGGRVKTFYDTIPPLGGAEQRVVVLQKVEPEAPEPPDPPRGRTEDKVAATPRFYFQSEPSGAEVYIDGRRRGRTPLAVDVEARPGVLAWPAVEVLVVHPDYLPETLMLEPQRSARLVKVPLRRYAAPR